MSSNIQGQASAGESATGIPPTSSHRSNNIPSNVTIGGRLDQGVQNTSSGIGTMTITEISAATATTTTTTTTVSHRWQREPIGYAVSSERRSMAMSGPPMC
mmetsp:Transcript_10150/g.14775  ORF Transcript_10150/g.14775 Transcript_10150/m.14775 type:complete len:101 (-) Transcript_10150:108-410(-)